MTLQLLTRIDSLQANYDNAEIKLAKLQAKPSNDRRSARIERIEDKQASRLERIDALTGQLPKDEFVPSFWVDPVTGENWGISVTITDSPYDDTYVGGTPVSMRISGRYCPTGLSGFAQTRGIYFGEKYPLIDATETIGFSSNRLNGDYSITLRLLNSDTRVPFYEQELIDNNGVQLI